MIIKEIDLSTLSRREYINLILLVICSFKVDYEYFESIEKDIIKKLLDQNWEEEDR